MKLLSSLIIPLLTHIALSVLYTVELTADQIHALSNVRIAEYKNRECSPVFQAINPLACDIFCDIYYNYVPNVQYNNLKSFNSSTQLCQPRPICPHGFTIEYDAKSNQCIDSMTGFVYQGLNSTMNMSFKRVNVTYNCSNGHVQLLHGIMECICDFSYQSTFNSTFDGTVTMQCDAVVPFVAYLPGYLQIYYDPALDNFMPNANDPDYWTLTLICYLKRLKYGILTFFQPYEVSIALLSVPQESNLRAQDLIFIIWLFFFSFCLCFCSIYQRCVNSYTLEEIQIENVNNQDKI